MTDLDLLDVLAAAATPETKGRWKLRVPDFGYGPDRKYGYVEWGDKDGGLGTAALSPALAAFIAACDPATIRSLVDDSRERDELRAAIEAIRDGEHDERYGRCPACNPRSAARAALHREDGT